MSSSPFHHFAFNHGTRKIAPLKIRNPSISPSQIMPSPSGVPFNIADMPWSYSGKPGQLMEFNAVIRPSPILQGGGPSLHHALPYPEMRKRKTEPDVIPIPSKQFFTDESMAIHMNNLHLSTEYTSHNIETTNIASEETLRSLSVSASSSSLDEDMSLGEAGPSTSTASSHVYMSPQELEERLKKAQRITLCEEVRKLDSRTEILPQVLLERIEKPCTALVLWQPPPVLEKILTNVSEALKEREERGKNHGKQQESSARRPNEVAMGEDEEALPDLPDYDDDLDFEENNNNVATVSDMNSMDVEM
ncbi:uncharacterized protein LOC110680232 isoform X1 [Aedes aegypti]|uniref:Uncharacterized protein n=3 Tax=Aedes aegypti TaxID=7159 RepID=A0A8W7J7U4_AEDAE|nr:uncharacterized protein LOC110678426 [Aedes aegypti]XP_021711738.1 uncharacterized protein LOC110680232 isoform X1 [Aedes aegypti]